uniref:Uncharacterized protein n=1 Tax=virus sp. ctML55 TaxID=2827627 RepID=A0A8S5RHT6_9VIRU|nr:MAG TPA: hypothetical protein [virus sp. ctML55]
MLLQHCRLILQLLILIFIYSEYIIVLLLLSIRFRKIIFLS